MSKIKVYGIDKRTGVDSMRMEIAEIHNISSDCFKRPKLIDSSGYDKSWFITCKCQLEYIDHEAYTDSKCKCCCRCRCCKSIKCKHCN